MKHFIIIALLVIASTFAIHGGLSSIGLLPVQASAQAVSIDQLFGIYIWAIAFVFSLIIVILLYSLVVFRRRKGETSTLETFVHNRESPTRPHKHLHLRPSTIQEKENIARQRISPQHGPYLVRQAFERPVQIGWCRGQVQPDRSRQQDHVSSLRSSSMANSATQATVEASAW